MISTLMFVFSACEEPEVGVEWVNQYSAVWKDNLNYMDDCANGFYDVISSHPDWEGKFNVGNANAWEKHFKKESLGGLDSTWIDAVDLAMFAGHGSAETGTGRGSAFTFGQNAHDDWYLVSIPTDREPRWGDGDLEWIIFNSCSILCRLGDVSAHPDEEPVSYSICQRWANSDVMHGLHYILGFRTTTYDYTSRDRGEIFAQYLMGLRGDGTKHTVRCAWILATIETDQTASNLGAYLRAQSDGANTKNDHIWECGSVSDDPDPASQCYWYCSWPCI
jgi:hypothetical protein